MDTQALDFIWKVVISGLHQKMLAPDRLVNEYFVGAFDFPRPIDDLLAQFFVASDEDVAQKIADWLVTSFSLSGIAPERHIALVAELLRRKVLEPAEAVNLVRLDASNFALLTEEGREILRIAELLGEDCLIETEYEVVTSLLEPVKLEPQ